MTVERNLDVQNPLFIIGTGRCGSTVFHQMLSYHPNVSWLSSWCAERPNRPDRNRTAMRLLDLPLPDRLVRRRVRTGEFYPFWNRYYGGFGEPCRDLVADDVTLPVKSALRKAFGAMLLPHRDRLLIKITGWPRAGFLKAVFPDARFIHIYRDGRSVANSWLQVWWWDGWGGPERWRWGRLSPAQREKWEQHGRSFVSLAGLAWEILMDAFDAARRALPAEDVLEIRYEDLCRDPMAPSRLAVEFAGLPWSPRFESAVRRFKLESANDKWRRDLTDAQQHVLNDTLRETLQRYGYA